MEYTYVDATDHLDAARAVGCARAGRELPALSRASVSCPGQSIWHHHHRSTDEPPAPGRQSVRARLLRADLQAACPRAISSTANAVSSVLRRYGVGGAGSGARVPALEIELQPARECCTTFARPYSAALLRRRGAT